MTKKRAIQSALARLGLQASSKQIVAALADMGIAVNEDLVRRVKFDMVKQAARVEGQNLSIPKLQRPKAHHFKVPPRRGNRS
jgi:hypothetical protein